MKTLTNYVFTVQIEAENREQAKRVLNSSLDLMRYVKAYSSAERFCNVVEKIKGSPYLIEKALYLI